MDVTGHAYLKDIAYDKRVRNSRKLHGIEPKGNEYSIARVSRTSASE
jgi:hypothetical protein